MLKKTIPGGVSMSMILAACVATSGCVYERVIGGEGGAGGEGGHAIIETVEGPGGGCDSGAGGHSVGGGPDTNPGAGGHEVGGGPQTGAGGEGGFGVGGGPQTGAGGEGGFGVGGGPQTGAGGQGGAEECSTCAGVVLNGSSAPFCDDSSAQLYDALALCVCEGACVEECGDNVCLAQPSDPVCEQCILSNQGCGLEYEACINDG